jgi:EAL domain-containing protein (putative c-di-GMP-specific phosphodiesterase class I)
LTLPWESVSKEHAEIYEDRGRLRVRDLKSTNGTFLNRLRIDNEPVREGDVLHFAGFEFRLGRHGVSSRGLGAGSEQEFTTVATGSEVELPYRFVEGTSELSALLREGAVFPVFQCIVKLPKVSVAGYEVLGRGRRPDLPAAPIELFRIASSVGVEADLSQLFRRRGLEAVGGRGDVSTLFLKIHPMELEGGSLSRSLKKMREFAPHMNLVVEMRESAQADPTTIANLRALLYELNIGLAYDDFRLSQGRLLELAEAPPEFLKFDMRFIRAIDKAQPSKRRLLTSLVSAARDLMVQSVAQGVETAAEAQTCAKIGFTHAQGFFFGRPVPIEQLESTPDFDFSS